MTDAARVSGLVSVVVPVYNRPTMLREAIDSVLGQTYRPLEIVIVDDGSTDETPTVIAELEQANPAVVRSIRQTNLGPGAARETGRKAARGEYLQFLDSDDLLLPRKFELQVAALQAEGRPSTCYGRTNRVRPDGTVEGPARETGRRLDSMFPEITVRRLWITATPLYLSRVCELAGGWAPLRLDEDWEFETRIACVEQRLVYVEEAVCVHRDHTGARAGAGDPLDRVRLLQQAEAQLRIHRALGQSGHPRAAREARTVARRWFFLARRCAAVGLSDEARRLLVAARALLRNDSIAGGFDMRVFRLFASLFGWRAAGRLASVLDRWLEGRRARRIVSLGPEEIR
ncbi:MAG: hypothetical protein AMXMBFR36_17890 [Acidobacteriota bacterium]